MKTARSLAVVTSAAMAALLAGACGSDDPPTTSGTVTAEPVDGAGSSAATGPDATGTSVAPLDEVALLPLLEVDSLSAMTPLPGTGRFLLAQRDGKVLLADPAAGTVEATVVDRSSRTAAEGEQGLLGLAVSPDGAKLYLYYTDRAGDSVLEEVDLDPSGVAVGGGRVLLQLDQPFPNHNGGQLVFGPDGYLYLGLGDGGSAGDPQGAGQDPGQLLGSILRIDPTGGAPYGIPADNPFVDGGGAPEVWLYGVRNPWRFSFDRGTGDLWVADVGQNRFEEITRLPATGDGTAGRAANLGWAAMEGVEPFEGGAEPPDHVAPLYTYGREDGCSITGGYVYRGRELAFLEGVYLFGDWCTSRIWGLRLDDDGAVTERLDLGVGLGANQLVSFGEDVDGEVYVLADDGTLYRLTRAAG